MGIGSPTHPNRPTTTKIGRDLVAKVADYTGLRVWDKQTQSVAWISGKCQFTPASDLFQRSRPALSRSGRRGLEDRNWRCARALASSKLAFYRHIEVIRVVNKVLFLKSVRAGQHCKMFCFRPGMGSRGRHCPLFSDGGTKRAIFSRKRETSAASPPAD